MQGSGGKQPRQSRDGLVSPDGPGPASETERCKTIKPVVKPPQVWNQLKSGGYGLGRQHGADPTDGNATPKLVFDAGGEAMVKACGVAMDRLSGEKLGIDPVNGYIVNVGTASGLPSPPAGRVGGGKAHRRLMIPGWDGGSVVVAGVTTCHRDRESRLQGEGTQRVSSGGTGMPRGRL